MSTKSPASTGSIEQIIGKPLAVLIADVIAENIFDGLLQPGERLKEEELSARFRTSRAPVREALYLLQIDGLVERLPRRGTVVRHYTDEDIRDLYEVRATLECSAIDRLCTRWTKAFERMFVELLEEMKNVISRADSQAYSEHNTRFHTLLLSCAGSNILNRLYEQLGNPLHFLVHYSTRSVEQMKASYLEHEQIVKHLIEGDFKVAQDLVRTNVHHGMTRVIALRQQANGN